MSPLTAPSFRLARMHVYINSCPVTASHAHGKMTEGRREVAGEVSSNFLTLHHRAQEKGTQGVDVGSQTQIA